jgi:phosphomannomutase/phosphoglucomutase
VETLLSENFRNLKPKKAIVVTNIASSLAFDVIAKKYQAEIYRVPIGEHYLAIKMKELQENFPNAIIFGGEGSSGGFMYPSFNNARDGIFATCKICELLSNTKKKFIDLVEELPKFYSLRKYIQTSKPIELMSRLKYLLTSSGKSYKAIENDIRIVNEENMEWVLIHPSNTEPLIRIIAESPSIKNTKNLVKMIVNYMKRN